MIVKKRQGLEWGTGMMVLAGMDGFDDEPADEIQGGIEYEIGEKLPLEPKAGSASKKS